MKNKIFFVIYLNGEIIKTILDAMRILADPKQKNFSHITVKGPYKSVQSKKLMEDNEAIHGKEIKVNGVGNFFIEQQNTVFLKCEEKRELYDIWKTKEEKTYKQFHPHITIYDGSDREFAENLFATINKHRINFSFIVEKLEMYSSSNRSIFNLKSQVNYKRLSEIACMQITQENVDTIDPDERIRIIDKLCYILESLDPFYKDHLNDNSKNPKEQGLLIEV